MAMSRGDFAKKFIGKNEGEVTFPSKDGKSFYKVGKAARSQRQAIGCPPRTRQAIAPVARPGREKVHGETWGVGAGTSCIASNHAGH